MVPFKDLLCTSFKDLNIFRLKENLFVVCPVDRLNEPFANSGRKRPRRSDPEVPPAASDGHITCTQISYIIQ
jgi:hypothetical protein